MMKLIRILAELALVTVLLIGTGVPVLAQISARNMILNSGLPTEKLPDGSTNTVTRGRDAVNAYRSAHEQLYAHGWYLGIAGDHVPLLNALTNQLNNLGFTSNETDKKKKTSEILDKFNAASFDQNAVDLGYADYKALTDDLTAKALTAEDKNAKQVDKDALKSLVDDFTGKWK